MSKDTFKCFSCNSPLEDLLSSPVGRGATCFKCLSDVRCCMNCQFYDPSSYNSCEESQAERVVEKERANFCDWFKPGGNNKEGKDQKKSDALAALDDLFK